MGRNRESIRRGDLSAIVVEQWDDGGSLAFLFPRRSTPESRLSSLIFGARSEIIRWTWIDTRYLRAYGKSKHSQDTDRASTCAEAINEKGTSSRCSAIAQGQNRTIDQALLRTGSSLAERIAGSCGRSPTPLFPPEPRAFLTRLRNAGSAGNEAINPLKARIAENEGHEHDKSRSRQCTGENTVLVEVLVNCCSARSTCFGQPVPKPSICKAKGYRLTRPIRLKRPTLPRRPRLPASPCRLGSRTLRRAGRETTSGEPGAPRTTNHFSPLTFHFSPDLNVARQAGFGR
jgi:hypothetical protein